MPTYDDIYSLLCLDCAHSKNYKQRILFIETCTYILNGFSRHFFKQQGFYTAVVDLAKV